MSNSTQNPNFEIANYGIEGEHPLTSCTVIASYKDMKLDIQTTCKLHRTSLNCQTYTEDNINEDDEDFMIDKAEEWLIEYCKNRFVDIEDTSIKNALLDYEVLQDWGDDSYVILLHDNRYINSVASPYVIPYEIHLVDDKEELEELAKDPDLVASIFEDKKRF